MTEREMHDHFMNLVVGDAVYLWGANCEKITEALCTRLYKTYGSVKYNKAYYTSKLNEGKGRIGADCSGSFFPVSGRDTTANGYYNDCVKKGLIKDLPNKPCMVFVKQGGKMVHIGWYDGEDKVFEMKDSKSNVRHDKLDKRWTHYGVPAFVEYEDARGKEYMISMRTLRKGMKGDDVKALQILLNGYGYSCGRSGADGDYGANTEKAVKKYQKDHSLVSDGIAGEKTMTSLLK